MNTVPSAIGHAAGGSTSSIATPCQWRSRRGRPGQRDAYAEVAVAVRRRPLLRRTEARHQQGALDAAAQQGADDVDQVAHQRVFVQPGAKARLPEDAAHQEDGVAGTVAAVGPDDDAAAAAFALDRARQELEQRSAGAGHRSKPPRHLRQRLSVKGRTSHLLKERRRGAPCFPGCVAQAIPGPFEEGRTMYATAEVRWFGRGDAPAAVRHLVRRRAVAAEGGAIAARPLPEDRQRRHRHQAARRQAGVQAAPGEPRSGRTRTRDRRAD